MVGCSITVRQKIMERGSCLPHGSQETEKEREREMERVTGRGR
jgi:hypothetical protein